MELIYQLSSGLHTRIHIPDTHRNKVVFFPYEAILKADGKPPFITIFPPLELILNLLGTDYITKVINFPK